jgi:hypothetical protein
VKIACFRQQWAGLHLFSPMGYYIRVLGKNPDNVSLNHLREKARPAALNVSEGGDENWEQLILSHESGQEIALVERNLVIKGRLGADELQEFIDEVAHLKPESAGTSPYHSLTGVVSVITCLQQLRIPPRSLLR